MWQVIVPVVAALGGGYLFVARGKAHIGDTVEVNYKPGGVFGDQAVLVQGRVTEKTNPILGPYYTVQLFALPKVDQPTVNPEDIPILNSPEVRGITTSPELRGIDPTLIRGIPSTISGVKDSDITRNLSRK